MKKTTMHIYIDETLKMQVQILAIKKKKSVSELVTELLEEEVSNSET